MKLLDKSRRFLQRINQKLQRTNNSSKASSSGYPNLPTCYLSIHSEELTRQISNERGNIYDWVNGLSEGLLKQMYLSLDEMPPVSKVHVKVLPFDGVAFTKDAGYLTKEIQISLTYLLKIPQERRVSELEGVLCHEMVHAYQYDGSHTAPSGFIEGVADYYRLKMGLAPPHWNPRDTPEKWDGGYEKTGYFLHFVESMRPDAVYRMNMYLRDHKWSEKEIFTYGTGEHASSLFQTYKRAR